MTPTLDLNDFGNHVAFCFFFSFPPIPFEPTQVFHSSPKHEFKFCVHIFTPVYVNVGAPGGFLLCQKALGIFIQQIQTLS